MPPGGPAVSEVEPLVSPEAKFKSSERGEYYSQKDLREV